MTRERFISFPPGAVAPNPQRIPILWDRDGAIALDKPAALSAFEKPESDDVAHSLVDSINERARTAPQFQRLDIQSIAIVNFLAADSSGFLLLAKNHKAKVFLRNALGSHQFVFRYRFLSAGDIDSDEIECELPVARHRTKREALVSNRTGKKSFTKFRRIERMGSLSLWESESFYDRFHQVRLHAAEVGIPIFEDPIYAKEDLTSDRFRRREPFFLHLSSLSFPWDGGIETVEAPLPRLFERILRKQRNQR